VIFEQVPLMMSGITNFTLPPKPVFTP
jgi:hypothetical protein